MAHETPAIKLYKNFKTDDNTLSTYELDDNETLTEQIILCGHALTRNNFYQIDYLKIPQDLIGKLGLELDKTPGQTPLEKVNNLHADIVKISVKKLSDMVLHLLSEISPIRITATQVEALVKKYISDGTIKFEQLNSTLQEKIEKDQQPNQAS